MRTPRHMVFQPTAIHDHMEAGLSRELRRGFVDDTLLHPDSFRATRNRFFDDRQHVFRPAKDIDQIDQTRHSGERRIGTR